MQRRATATIVLALVVAVAMAMAACAPAAEAPATPKAAATKAPATKAATSQPAAKDKAETAGREPTGKVVLATNPTTSATTNPGAGNSGQGLTYYWPMFDGLTWVNREGAVEPGLATEWSSSDGRVWEFTLGDYSFHDGSPVTVDDVIGTMEYYKNPENRQPVGSTYANVESIEAVGDNGIRVTLARPDPTYPKLIALSMIMPIEEVRADAEKFFELPFGSGPFELVSADYNTALIYTATDPGFATPRGQPYVKDLEVRFIPEDAAKAAAIRTGEVDIAYPLTADAANALAADGYTLIVDPGTAAASFLLDHFNEPTSDVRVRQAINYAVDRATILETVFSGYGKLDGQLIGEEVLGYNPEVTPYAYDPDRARELLEEAGVGDGFTLPMTVLSIAAGGSAIGEAVAADLREVGIDVEITIKEPAVWVGDYYGAPEQRPGLWVQIINWDQTFEPNSVWRWYSSDIPLEGGRRWLDEEFDAMYQEAKTTLDDARREQLYRQAGEYLHEQAGALFLWRFGRPAVTGEATTWEPGLFADMFITRLQKAE